MGPFGNRKRSPFDPPPVYTTPGIGDGVLNRGEWEDTFPGMESAPPAKEKRKGFWAGGDKFTGKDALAGLLAALGDAFANQSGMPIGAAEGLIGSRMSARKMAEQERARAAVMERLVASGMDPNDANILAGDDTAVRQTIGQKYEKPEAPSFVKNLEAWGQMTPQQQQQVAQMQSVLNPRFMTGVDGLPYQTPPAQTGGPQPGMVEDGYQFMGGDPGDPRSWKQVGGGAGNGVGGFRPYRR